MVAAPLVVGRASLAASRGGIRAVIVNSGNANCATGEPGIRSCRQVCRELARLLKLRPDRDFSLLHRYHWRSSAGGKDRNPAARPGRGAHSNEAGLAEFAHAIMTTDTRPKLASATIQAGETAANILGIAKGAGMIHPQMATMLVYLLTDATCHRSRLKQCCQRPASSL